MTMYGAPDLERPDVEHARHVLALQPHRGARLAQEALDTLRRLPSASSRTNLMATR